jgi:hypothetical protein
MDTWKLYRWVRLKISFGYKSVVIVDVYGTVVLVEVCVLMIGVAD